MPPKSKSKKEEYSPLHERKNVALTLALISLFADGTGLWSFFVGGGATDFFSKTWFVHLVFIFIFLYVGIYCLAVAKMGNFRDSLLTVYGYGFNIITVCFYLLFGVAQFFEGIEVKQFLGCLIIIFLFGGSSIVILAFLVANSLAKKFIFERISYCFAFASFGLLLILFYKYLLQGEQIAITTLIIESLTIIVGAFAVIFLFRLAQENKMLERLINKLKSIKFLNLLFED